MPDQDHTTSVEYREIPGFRRYLCGSDGSIWSHLYGRWVLSRWIKLDGWTTEDGHQRVQLIADDDKHRTRGIHQLVLETFVGPCPPGLEACHNDGNPQNNRLGNLRWDTRQSNIGDQIEHGVFAGYRFQGEANPSAKLTTTVIDEIRRLLDCGLRQVDIAKRFGIHQSHVSRIKRGESWKL